MCCLNVTIRQRKLTNREADFVEVQGKTYAR